MGATLIQVTSWNKLSYLPEQYTATAVTVLINPARIVSVQTRATPYNTTGVTNIIYEFPFNQMRYQVQLVVTETQAAILTAANANVVAT